MLAESLRHQLGDVTENDARVFAYDENSGGFYEVYEVGESDGHVVLKMGDYHHSMPRTR